MSIKSGAASPARGEIWEVELEPDRRARAIGSTGPR